MLALEYYYSVPRYLLTKSLSALFPRRFFSRLAPVRLREVPFAKPRPDWVVLRPRLCGLCGSDLNLLRGQESYLLEPYASFPCILGHEVVAEVVEAPADSGFGPGDRVAVEPLLACGARGLAPCRYCAQGDYNLCESFTEGELPAGVILGFTHRAGGGLAEMMAAPPGNLFRLPPELPDETAVLTDSLASALQPVLDHFPPDEATVVIYGAGIIGQHVLRALRGLGSRARLVVVARYPFQERLAAAGGADLVLMSPSRRDLGEALGARFLPTTLGGGNLEGGAEYFFDCVGNKNSFQAGLAGPEGPGGAGAGGHCRGFGAGGHFQFVVPGVASDGVGHVRLWSAPRPAPAHLRGGPGTPCQPGLSQGRTGEPHLSPGPLPPGFQGRAGQTDPPERQGGRGFEGINLNVWERE
jgi:erythritol/L-threitol dehydrogenase